MPHHVSKTHPQMSRNDRAAQFSPFAALTGYEAVVEEAGRRTESQREMGEDDAFIINENLNYIRRNISKNPLVRVRYFVPDLIKSGGKYETVCARVRSFDERSFSLILFGDVSIDVQSIDDIEIIG